MRKSTFGRQHACRVTDVSRQTGLIASALGTPISPSLLVIGAPVVNFTNLLAVTPGGLAIVEASWFGILYFGGVSTGDAKLFVVGQRLLTVFSIMLALIIGQAHKAFIVRG